MRYEELPDVLTVAELKELLKIGTNKAYELVNASDFPVIKIGRQYRIPKQSLIEWLEKEARKNEHELGA